MEIFYLKKSEFLKSVDRASLEYFSDGREYSSVEKYLEHLLGLFLTKFIAKHFYEINDLEIEIRNRKPFFKNSDWFFSISHSEDIVSVVFDNKNVGADVEFIRDGKNFKAIMERYGENVENPTREEFYRFWTLHEAEIKLGSQIKSIFSTTFERDYMLTCVSDEALVSTFCVKKLVSLGEDIDLIKELESPKNCQLISSVE
jgi:phosphopantetheinyl transferase